MKFSKFINPLLILAILSTMSSTKRKKLKIDTLPKSKENTNVEDSIGSIFDNSHYLSHVLAYDDSQIDTFIYPNSSKKTEAKLIHSVIDIRSKYNYCDDHKVRVLVGKSLESPNILVIIFRGTDNICKETDDLKIPQTFITIKKYKAFKDAKVHEGFMNLYRSIRHEYA